MQFAPSMSRSRLLATDYHKVVGHSDRETNLHSVLNTNRRKQMNTATFQESILDKVGFATLLIVAALTVIGQFALML